MVGGLVAGAQVTCILSVPSMLAWAFYHYSAGGIPHAILSLAFTAALAYFGFVPFPMVQSFEWTAAAIFLTIITVLTILPGLLISVGGKFMENEYEQKPWVKEQYCDDLPKSKSYRRARELALGVQLLGAGCCQAAAIVSGGAQDTCLLTAPMVFMNGYCHWLKREHGPSEKGGAIFCWIIAAVQIVLGIAR